jgi:hypothetical protein
VVQLENNRNVECVVTHCKLSVKRQQASRPDGPERLAGVGMRYRFMLMTVSSMVSTVVMDFELA